MNSAISEKRGRGRPKGSKNKKIKEEHQCIAISKFNLRCKNKKVLHSDYCGHHKKENQCQMFVIQLIKL